MINSDKIRKILGKNIQKLRKEKGLSQEKLAELVGLERDSISSIETGRAFVSSDTFANFCNYFNIEPQYLLTEKNIEYTNVEINLLKEINRSLYGCAREFLESILKIIQVLKK